MPLHRCCENSRSYDVVLATVQSVSDPDKAVEQPVVADRRPTTDRVDRLGRSCDAMGITDPLLPSVFLNAVVVSVRYAVDL